MIERLTRMTGIGYDERSTSRLAGGAVHGTQNFTPFVGVAWSFGR